MGNSKLKNLHAWGRLSAVFNLFALTFALLTICETVCVSNVEMLNLKT